MCRQAQRSSAGRGGWGLAKAAVQVTVVIECAQAVIATLGSKHVCHSSSTAASLTPQTGSTLLASSAVSQPRTAMAVHKCHQKPSKSL